LGIWVTGNKEALAVFARASSYSALLLFFLEHDLQASTYFLNSLKSNKALSE
jgi:hypothetical protein